MNGAESVRIAVYGASGFIGAHVVSALKARQVTVVKIQSPRADPRSMIASPGQHDDSLWSRALQQLHGVDVVINAAGLPDAGARGSRNMAWANTHLPRLILEMSRAAGARRLVHISSAAVQGRVATLDSSMHMAPLTPYAQTKAEAETILLRENGAQPPAVVVFRPAGVHGAGRPTTQSLVRLGRLGFLACAGDGSGPAPQALVTNVADAIAHLATLDETPPPIVHHPWEGLTCRELLEFMSGRMPRRISEGFARSCISSLWKLGGHVPWASAQARRLEVMWLGQRIARSWLEESGWRPSHGREEWRKLAIGQVPTKVRT